mgnify:CR=1 FL=1
MEVKKLKVALIAPTINEIDGLRAVFPRLDKNIIDEIIVVDLNSTDGTVEYCREHGYRVHHQRERGYGMAYTEALALTDADIFIEFCPDGSSVPEKIPELLAKINEGYDFVIASRYRDGAVSQDDSILTHFGNWLFTTMVNVLFGTHYTDVLVGFKAYRRSAFNRVLPTSRSMAWAVQIPIRFSKIGVRVAEIGADEPARIGGIRKMHPLKTGWAILKLIIQEFLAGKKFAKTSL